MICNTTKKEQIKLIIEKEGYQKNKQLKVLLNKMILQGFDLSIITENDFDMHQLQQIYNGYCLGIDYKKYAKSKFNCHQMVVYKKALMDGLDTSCFDNNNLTSIEMEWIYTIMKYDDKLDFSIILKKKFNKTQLEQVAKGIMSRVDISLFTNVKFLAAQMIHIRIGLENGIDVLSYCDPKINYKTMKSKRLKLESQKIKEMLG